MQLEQAPIFILRTGRLLLGIFVPATPVSVPRSLFVPSNANARRAFDAPPSPYFAITAN